MYNVWNLTGRFWSCAFDFVDRKEAEEWMLDTVAVNSQDKYEVRERDRTKEAETSKSPPDCRNCKHAGSDPDGPYCGHPESLKQTVFGRSFNMMRNELANPETAVCGLNGKLFEERGK